MKNLVLTILFIGLIFQACKKENIQVIAKPMYKTELTVFTMDANNDFTKNFVSLHGYTTSVFNIFTPEAPIVPKENVDFGLTPDNNISAPGSNYGLNNFVYRYNDYSTSNWGTANSGYFAITSLNKTDFDTLERIEAVTPFTQTCSDENEDMQSNIGKVLAFNLPNGYGLIYVKAADGSGATIDMKYYLNKP